MAATLATEPDRPSLEQVAQAYRDALAHGTTQELSLTGYDRTGVPVVATTWRGVLDDGTAYDAHGVGYGETEAAAVGAWGELAERVLLRGHLAERTSVGPSRRRRSRPAATSPVRPRDEEQATTPHRGRLVADPAPRALRSRCFLTRGDGPRVSRAGRGSARVGP